MSNTERIGDPLEEQIIRFCSYESLDCLFEKKHLGLSFPPGWKYIVYAACAQLKLIEGVKIYQICEHFTRLKIYTNISNPEVEKILAFAEKESLRTCMGCGIYHIDPTIAIYPETLEEAKLVGFQSYNDGRRQYCLDCWVDVEG